MVELDQLDPSETVSLFEEYQDVFLNQICESLNLPVSFKAFLCFSYVLQAN